MVRTKPLEAWTNNWKNAIPGVQARYNAGIDNADGVVEAMKAGQANYEQQMMNAAVLARRLTGLNRIDDTLWKTRAKTKGGPRIGPGMSASINEFNQAAAKNKQILDNTTLPPRTTDYMTNITNRVGAIVRALKEGWGKA